MTQQLTLLVTGSTGFIGKNIVNAFRDTHTVLTPSHSELDLQNEDAVAHYFMDHTVDIVIHTANVGGKRNTLAPTDAFFQNLRMFYNLTRCEKFYKKMIFFGSGAEYDKRYSISEVREGDFDVHVPIDEYGFSKYLYTKYIETTSSTKFINLRLFGIFGEYEDYRIRFISQGICRTLYDMPIIIHQNCDFTYLYIHDLFPILEYIIKENPSHAIYNIGTNIKTDLLTIAKRIKRIAHNPHKIIIEKPGKGKEYTCNSSRLLTEVPTLQFTPLDEAIENLYIWYKHNQQPLTKKQLLENT